MSSSRREPQVRPRLLHPLMGADPLTLATVLARSGGVPPSRLPHAVLAFGVSVARLPSTLLEGAVVELRRWRAPEADPPIFIVGHWRSGTTHLYNLLARDPALGWVSPLATGMPWDFLGLVKVLRPLLEAAIPEDRGIDRVPVRPDSPQEDEAALANMQPLSFYHGLYFPRRLREAFERGVFFDGATPGEVARWERRFRLFMDKLALDQPGRRIVIKNPVYTARVGFLARMYPGARFVHLHRNPWVVFESMRRFYRKLIPRLSLQPGEDPDTDALILDAYPRMLRRCVEEGEALPAGHYLEVAYERLDREPLAVLERMYGELDLGDFAGVRGRFREYLDSIGTYRKNPHRFAEEDVERVRERWGAWAERWGYEAPA